MIELIVQHGITYKILLKKLCTLKELGEELVDLSEKYILIFDTVRNIEPEIGCVLYVSAVNRG